MNRNNSFNKFKIYSASTNKVVLDVYLDSFEIEKVRFKNSEYGGEKRTIDCYLDFADIALLADGITNMTLFKELGKGQKTIYRGGSKASKVYNGAPESRIMSLGMVGEKIFVNMTTGKGKLSATGAIMPDGPSDKKVSVGMDVETFKKMILLTHDYVNAYLCSFVNRLVKESSAERAKAVS